MSNRTGGMYAGAGGISPERNAHPIPAPPGNPAGFQVPSSNPSHADTPAGGFA